MLDADQEMHMAKIRKMPPRRAMCSYLGDWKADMWKWLAFVLAFANGAASAQDAAAVFAALDTDRNGSISQMEAQRNQIVAANFTAADTNNDGALSQGEFVAAFGSN
jgi:hypothetical protein